MAAITGVLPRGSALGRADIAAMLTRAADEMRARAPTQGGSAVAYDGSIALAHRAGEGPGAESVLQPLTDESGRLWLVADGEPSNAPDLRLELIAAGHRFKSASGAEVILHVYQQEGVAGFERLAGGFAFALWDANHRELMLGRDRFGEKPLYVAERDDALSFASEVRALRAGAPLDAAALAAFLTFGYVPEPLSITVGVRAVPVGRVQRIRADRVREEHLWQETSIETTGTTEDDRARIARVLREAVQVAAQGEDHVGVPLTDGMWSVALLAILRPMLARGLTTHALAFDLGTGQGRRRSGGAAQLAAERDAMAARTVAEWFRSDHREHRITTAELGAAFGAAAEEDQPSTGAVVAHLNAACMRVSGARVALASIGSPALTRTEDGTWVPLLCHAARHASACLMTRLAAGAAMRVRPFGRAATVASYLGRGDGVAAAYLAGRSIFAPTGLARILRPEVLAAAQATFDPVAHLEDRARRTFGPAPLFAPRTPSAAAARVLTAIECTAELVSGSLRDAERAAAAHGLALHAPYLDHRLFEWATATGDGPAGCLMRDVVSGAVPARLKRRYGAALEPPLGAWMRGELRPLIEGHLFAPDPEGLFVETGIRSLWTQFLAGRAPWRPVWSLAVLRAWVAAQRGAAAGSGGRSGDRHAA